MIETEPLEWGWCLDAICGHLELVYYGEIRDLIITLPPRLLKSTIASVIWPGWCWANDPTLQFLTGSYEHTLATRDALRMRDLVTSQWYRERYGTHTTLRRDQNEKDLYINDAGGKRMAVSVGGKLTGFGAHIHLVDDPHNLQDIGSDVKREAACRWYTGPLRTRFNSYLTGRRVIIAQRSHAVDLVGYVMERSPGKYTHLCLQNEFVSAKRCSTVHPKTKRVLFSDPRTKEGELLFPQRLNREATEALKSEMGKSDYSAQYQQDPTVDGGLILKREYWRPWVEPAWRSNAGADKELPECFEIIQLYDTAIEEDESADYTARITVGLFRHADEAMRKIRLPDGRWVERPVKAGVRNCAILLGAWRDRLGFPELRQEAKRSYDKVKPDWVLIEKKASGSPLIKELRRAGVPVKAVKIDGDGDKVARAHVAALALEKGCMFYLPGKPWSKMVLDECADFPAGAHDDLVDCVLMALMWLRRSEGVQFQEEADEVRLFHPKRQSMIRTS